ncbi:nitroreductase family protein [Gaoshiqia sediminis]|uniref:Nitroreductase family protein n=1 Tax=Gaoshiqia sediminis TaxID=2986998 RepID=A0AA41Y3D0_9BACT|nr:nitroreductase family protein [Gaoshiqia sediminis]MCW0482684.1 nitroreductase family protein [Gaoshiqia sediminis]
MIELIRNRRSIRKFSPQAIEPEKITLLEEAVLRSPSSKNSNAWEFVFVDRPELISELAACKPHGSRFLEGAPLAVVVLADESKSDVWVEDCSIASILLQLTAQSLGLGSCWVQIRNRAHSDTLSAEAYVQELLGIPPNLRVLSIIAVGYAAQVRAGKPAAELQWDKISRNVFGKSGK